MSLSKANGPGPNFGISRLKRPISQLAMCMSRLRCMNPSTFCSEPQALSAFGSVCGPFGAQLHGAAVAGAPEAAHAGCSVNLQALGLDLFRVTLGANPAVSKYDRSQQGVILAIWGSYPCLDPCGCPKSIQNGGFRGDHGKQQRSMCWFGTVLFCKR